MLASPPQRAQYGVTVVDANNVIVADSRLEPLLSPVASENQRGEIGSGISNARGISEAQSLEGKIGNRLPWIDGLGRHQWGKGPSGVRAQCHITPLAAGLATAATPRAALATE